MQFSLLHRPKRLRNRKLERRVKNSGGWVKKIQHLKNMNSGIKAEENQRRIKPSIKKKIKTISQNYNTQISRLKVSRNMQENR